MEDEKNIYRSLELNMNNLIQAVDCYKVLNMESIKPIYCTSEKMSYTFVLLKFIL